MTRNYDIAVIGGGIAGAALDHSMAKAGARVLVSEAETQFKDRVRGEVLVPWGVAEAQELGLEVALQQADARGLPWLNQYMGPQLIERRDFAATTLTKTSVMTFYHPRMQTSLLNAAEASGAEVRRGVVVTSVVPGRPAHVTHKTNGETEEIAARLVVIADGRNSQLRRNAGFQVQCETHSLCTAGILLESVSVPEDTFHLFTNPALGEIIIWAPQGDARVRTYICYWGEARPRFQGAADVGRFIGSLAWTGTAGEYFSRATQAGPLATFEGADHWVEHPYQNGVALLGDTAASNDPTWGQGLSLGLRGARTLRDALLRSEDWDAAGHDYARELDRYYGKLRTVAGWFREFFMITGPEADARRARALPLIGQDPTRVPDLLFSGPEISLASDARARFFGED
jgi:2-polyprenyl-6-methoxyphenol hydroxylase-like FAD-dependent oxidoreductase